MENFSKAVDDTQRVTTEHYSPRVNRERENFEILDWGDRDAQFKRFEVLSNLINLHSLTLLDIGCGLGDLYSYLKSVDNRPTKYIGTDLVQEMVELAKEKQPSCQFYCCDVLKENPAHIKFDVVFCSGVFNLRTEDNLGFLNYALTALEELTTAQSRVVFNFLHHRTKKQYDHCFYYYPEVVKAKFLNFYSDVKIIDNYLSNDFTIIAMGRL